MSPFFFFHASITQEGPGGVLPLAAQLADQMSLIDQWSVEIRLRQDLADQMMAEACKRRDTIWPVDR